MASNLIRSGEIAILRNRCRAKGRSVPITIYGIKNCDTVKKARGWLDRHGVDYVFHDYKMAGIERERLERWCTKVGWQTLLNRAGTTFRKLPDKDKNNLDPGKAVALMLAQPSMIKRPVLELGGAKLLVGFSPRVYGEVLAGEAEKL
jgi:arsenate reductase (glutaredoxin)